jgi:DNA-binding response OmpR family regulator
MKVVFVRSCEELSGTISLILKVRWRELSFVCATEASEALELVRKEQPDIVMLHLDPPSADCFDFVSQIRMCYNVPLIVLSKNASVVDKIRALEMGADDWIASDCIPMEFIARVSAILRRCYPHSNNNISTFFNGKLRINYATRGVCVLGKQVKLAPIEYKLLHQLVRNEGSVVSRTNLLHSVWGADYEADPEFVRKHIHRLRSKIEEDPANPKIIVNERGAGYMYVSSPYSPNYRPSSSA